MKRVVLLVVLVLSISFIAGCSDVVENNPDNQEKNTISEEKTVNYEDYKGNWKLKVAEDEELYLLTSLEAYFGATGVNITEINDNFIKGSIYSIQGAPSYRQAEVTFEGEIQDGKLIAPYEDEGWLYTGNIEITFEDEKLALNITRDEVETTPMWGIPEGKFTFKRHINTEIVSLSDEEKSNLEQYLLLVAKDRIKPFNKGELTDEMIINFVGTNIWLGFFGTSEFSDKIKEKDGKVIFDKSVMDALANRYFGVNIKEHKSYNATTYENEIYTVQALGGVSEYPLVQIMMKDSESEGIYYTIVDYMFEYPEGEEQLEYEYLIELQKDDDYIIKSIKEIKVPIDFEILNQFLEQ